jgi:hypothetical protein
MFIVFSIHVLSSAMSIPDEDWMALVVDVIEGGHGVEGTTGLSCSNSSEERSIRTKRALTAPQEATNIESGSNVNEEINKLAVFSRGKGTGNNVMKDCNIYIDM